MFRTFTFNGGRRDYLMLYGQIKRPAWAAVKRNLLTIPGRPGALNKRTDVDVRSLEVPIQFLETEMTIQEITEDLAAWLVTDKPCPLILDNELNRVYYAMIDGSIDFEEIATLGKGVITFICLDPYKYKTSSKFAYSTLEEDVHLLKIRNEGTERVSPVFEVQVDNDYTHIDISNGNKVNRIGTVVNIEEYAKKREEMILNDKLTTTVGWAKTEGSVRIDGLATGDMKSDGYRFIAENFGTMVDGWHGPFYKKSFGQTLTDFKVEAVLELVNVSESRFGKVEVYLLDENNLPVCMLTLKRVDSSGKRNYVNLRLGGGDVGHKNIINTHGSREHTFWNFYGILRISKVGDKWEAYASTIDKQTGKHTARVFEAYVDNEKQFTRKPTQIGIYIAQYGSRSMASVRADDVRVYKINALTQNQIPYIVRADDVVTFDHQEKNILINGESRTDLKAFGGEFFHLERGDNVIVTSPPLPTKAIWRERFK